MLSVISLHLAKPDMSSFFITSLIAFFSSFAIALFSESSNTASKHPKGKATEGGSLIHSGSFPLRLARFFDFAPTIPSLKSVIPIDHFLHHEGLETFSLRFSASGASLEIKSDSSQVTDPAALVLIIMVLPAKLSNSSSGCASWHAAKRAFIFLHLTARCDNTSGASLETIPTAPRGTSSSPVTLAANKTVGFL